MLDFDNDGFEDLYFINGASLPGLTKVGTADWNRLYRNQGDGTFNAGATETGYGMGVAAADYDNDGWTDLYCGCESQHSMSEQSRRYFLRCDRTRWIDA